MAAVGLKGSLTLTVLSYLIWATVAAPVDEGTSHALQLSDSIGDGRGCYYNFEHYGEGDRILTNEPCLNCTCHNRMLMCYLRVCPFTKAIGQDCTVEKKPDQCCPVITCPQVPVALLTSSTTSEAPLTTTALGRLDNYGCLLEDNTFYADGAQVPSDPRKPCELCYCIRNHTACVMQECTLNVEGCKPVYQEGVCCPVRYDCDYDDVATTPKPTIGLVTTPGGPSDCLHNGRVYHDGAMVMKDEKAPCEHCYCMRGDIVCAVQECGTPLEGTNCTPMEPKRGQCCPNYECTNGTFSTENYFNALSSSTETVPEPSVTESSKNEKPDSDESSNEASSEESNEESKEGSGSEVSKPVSEVHPSNNNEQETSSAEPEQTEVSDDSSASTSDEHFTKQPDTNEVVTAETPNLDTINGQPADSISEATQDQDVTHIDEAANNLGEGHETVVGQENTHKQDDNVEQEDGTTPKQEVILEQDVTHEPEATHENEGVTQEPQSTHEHDASHTQEAASDHEATHTQEATSEHEATHGQEATSEQNETTHEQEAAHNQEVTQETQVSKDEEASGEKDVAHQLDTNEQDVTPAQEEATHAPEVIHEHETPGVQDATHEPDVTPAQEEATHAPLIIHDQEKPDEQDVANVQDVVTQPPQVTHEQESPIVQDAAHEQDVTHIQEEVTQAPQVAHEQETPDVPKHEQEDTHKQDATQEQEATNVQETTNAPVAIVDQSTVKPEIQTQAPIEVVKDSQVTNEIPESTPHEQSELSTEGPPAVEVPRVPGEGSCLVDGKTYAHNTIISSENPCHEECKCYSSIVTCKTKECTPAPTQYEHCMPVTTPGSCCPTYMCDQKPSDAPEAHSQLSEHTDDASHSDVSEEVASDNIGTTQASVESEHKDHSIAPVVEDIPQDTLQPGSDENVVQPQENHHEPEIQTTEQTSPSADIPSPNVNEDEKVNSHIVHGEDAAIHEGQLDAMDNKLESGNRPHPSEDTTAAPVVPEKPVEESQEKETSQEPESTNVDHTEEAPVKHDDESLPSVDEDSPQVPHDITSSPKPEEESAPTQQTSFVGSEDSEKIHSETPETTINYVPEVTTAHQDLHEHQDSTVSSADNVEGEENNNYDTSTDSKIDESKNEESIVTIKPTEINIPHESIGENTEHYEHIPTEGPIGIPDQSHSQYDNDPEQIQGAILFQQTTESGSSPEATTENIAVSGDPNVPSVSSQVPDENQNVVTEGNVPSETGSPHKQDSDVEADQESSGSVGNDEIVTSLPHVTGSSYETTAEPSSEVPSSFSDEKATEPSINQVSGETNDDTKHVFEETTDSVMQTTIRQETLSNAESQDESEVQESNNIVSSTTENEKPNDIATHPPIVNQDDNENADEKLENTTPQEKLEQPSEENLHNDEVVSNTESVLTDEAHSEEKPIQEAHEQDAVEPETHHVPETSTEEVKSEESDSHQPSEVTDTPVNQNENNVHSDSSPTVIFEEVTVTGSPSIESHVTEGTQDHSMHIINDLHESDTVQTTEHPEPAKESSPSNEVQTSNEPVNTETPIEPSVGTEKTILEQPVEDNTAPPNQDEQNMEDQHHETSSSHQEISSSEPSSDEIATTPKPSTEETSHQNVVNENEIPKGTDEADPTQPSSLDQTTSTPNNGAVQDINESSNQVVSEESTSIPNEIIPTPSSDDHKNEETPLLEESPEKPAEDYQPVSGVTTESSNVVEQETTVIPQADPMEPVIQQEVNADDKDEVNTVDQAHTDAPLEDEKVNDDTEPNPTQSQTDHEETPNVTHEEAPHVTHGEVPHVTNVTNEDSPVESTEIIPTTDSNVVTNAPVQTVHDETSHDATETETQPEPHQNEVLQQETTEAPVSNQPENTSEDSSHADHLDTVKETTPEVPQVPTQPPSESTEVSSSDDKDSSHEVPSEHKPEPEQYATPTYNEGSESSTSHETVVSQTENIVPSSSGVSNDIVQSSGGNEDSTTPAPQVTHLEHAAPPAPDSDSHVLETNEGEVESVTPAAEQTTGAEQSSVSDSNQQNVEESHHDDVPHNPNETEPEPETEPQQPIVNEPAPEVPSFPTTHVPDLAETSPGFVNHESSTVHPEIHSHVSSEHINEDIPSSTEHSSAEDSQTTPKESVPETQKIETEKPVDSVPVTESTSSVPPAPEQPEQHEVSSEQPEEHVVSSEQPEEHVVSSELPEEHVVSSEQPEEHVVSSEQPEQHVVSSEQPEQHVVSSGQPEQHEVSSEQPEDQSSKVPVTPSTEAAPLNEILSSTHKPIIHHEESPSFPTWSQKPFEHHTTPEPHPPEENHYPSGFDPEYEDEEGVSYGPGTCRYGGKVYLSAQQIPRDDPCDFCFCFRSDIICLQQSCPPPIRGCYQETIKGFCCPRYECHVSMATMLNMTTTTTTTTTTLPPHFLAHAYNGAATKAGCQVKDVAYSVGERIPSTSGPCLECRCGANGQMKCDPTVCGPQEALLRQVMDAAVSRRR